MQKNDSNFIVFHFFMFFFSINFYIILSFSLAIKVTGKMPSILNIHCYSHQVKKQLNNKNGARVLTVND